MKRKRLDRDVWTFDRYPYSQTRLDTEDFHGLACVIRLQGGVEHVDGGRTQYWTREKAGRAAICGEGMIWLEMIPDGHSHVLTSMFLPDHRVSMWYADVIEGIEYDPDGVAVFWDKYLDVTFTPAGDVGVEDRDELDAALASGDITQAQHAAALREGDYILETYCADIPKTEAICRRVLTAALDKEGITP